jgi:hypothetical protein
MLLLITKPDGIRIPRNAHRNSRITKTSGKKLEAMAILLAYFDFIAMPIEKDE